MEAEDFCRSQAERRGWGWRCRSHAAVPGPQGARAGVPTPGYLQCCCLLCVLPLPWPSKGRQGQARTGSAEPSAEICFLSACRCWRHQPWLCSPWQPQCPEPTGVCSQHISGMSKLCCRSSKRFSTRSRGLSSGHFGPVALLLHPRCQHNIPVAGKLCRSWCPGGIGTVTRAVSEARGQGGPRMVSPGSVGPASLQPSAMSRQCLENSQGAGWGQGQTLSPSCLQVMLAEQPGSPWSRLKRAQTPHRALPCPQVTSNAVPKPQAKSCRFLSHRRQGLTHTTGQHWGAAAPTSWDVLDSRCCFLSVSAMLSSPPALLPLPGSPACPSLPRPGPPQLCWGSRSATGVGSGLFSTAGVCSSFGGACHPPWLCAEPVP